MEHGILPRFGFRIVPVIGHILERGTQRHFQITFFRADPRPTDCVWRLNLLACRIRFDYAFAGTREKTIRV
jgi:hypothetical protein